MMPKTRSRKFAPIFSSRRFIVLGICNPFRIKFCTQRSPFKPCFWKCLSSVSLHMTLHNLSRLPADRVWLVPEEMTSGRLLSAQGQPLIGAAPPRCFPGSHWSPGTKNTASEGTGPEPLSSQKEKRCFWSLKLNFQAPSQVHEGL